PVPVRGIFFDCLPLGKDRALMFVLWDDHMEVWEGEGTWSEKRQRWEVKWPEKPTAAVATQNAGLGDEPFTAYAKGTTWFFLSRRAPPLLLPPPRGNAFAPPGRPGGRRGGEGGGGAPPPAARGGGAGPGAGQPLLFRPPQGGGRQAGPADARRPAGRLLRAGQ